MRKHILRKDFLMEIRRNKSRFLSILAIVTLGVAFFAGIRASGTGCHRHSHCCCHYQS